MVVLESDCFVLLNQSLVSKVTLFLGNLALAFRCFMNCYNRDYGGSTGYCSTDCNNFHYISTATAVKT